MSMVSIIMMMTMYYRSCDTFCQHFSIRPYYAIIDALQLYLEVGESQSAEKLKVDQVNKAIVQMEEKNKSLKEDFAMRKEKRNQDLEKLQATDTAKKQAQSNAKRSRKPKGDGPQKKKAKTDQNTDKRTMYINKRIAKMFDGEDGKQEVFFGTIDRVTNPRDPFYWHVLYDDEDEEEFDEKDVVEGLKRYQVYRHHDTEYQSAGAAAAAAPSVVDGLSRGEPTAEAGTGENGGTT